MTVRVRHRTRSSTSSLSRLQTRQQIRMVRLPTPINRRPLPQARWSDMGGWFLGVINVRGEHTLWDGASLYGLVYVIVFSFILSLHHVYSAYRMNGHGFNNLSMVWLGIVHRRMPCMDTRWASPVVKGLVCSSTIVRHKSLKSECLLSVS